MNNNNVLSNIVDNDTIQTFINNRFNKISILPYNIFYSKFVSDNNILTIKQDIHLGNIVNIFGRIIRKRVSGGIFFLTLTDNTFDIIQIIATVHNIDKEKYSLYKKAIDIGDIVGIEGSVIYSKTGELSISASGIELLGKCLYPFPDKLKGVMNPIVRLKKRYLGMISDNTLPMRLQKRFQALKLIRDFFTKHDYTEVDTSIIQTMYSGANAAPFTVYSEEYKKDLYLRIAPELQLKTLLVGGFDKIFEIGKNFRNEGIDSYHNFEFTALEAYQKNYDMNDMKILVENLIKYVSLLLNKTDKLLYSSSMERRSKSLLTIDISEQWNTVNIYDELSSILNIELKCTTDESIFDKILQDYKIEFNKVDSKWKKLEKIYNVLLEKKTITPTYYVGFPTALTPLARSYEKCKNCAERWDLVIDGMEIATGYSELTDPLEQYKRFEIQKREYKDDPEGMQMDVSFLEALSYGLPPTGGIGVGVDRLIMLLSGSNLRDITPFPVIAD